jgi:hypothetical protein
MQFTRTLNLFNALLALAFSQVIFAADSDGMPGKIAVTPNQAEEQAQSLREAREFGTTRNFIHHIPATNFVPAYPEITKTLEFSSLGYWRRSASDTGTTWVAHMNLPDGVLICWLDAFVYDNDTGPGKHVQLTMYEYPGYDSGTVWFVERESVTSSNGGYGYVGAAVNGGACRTVNTDVEYSGGAFYMLWLTIPAATSSPNELLLKGADIWWKRQISAAPGTASFSDVPTGHWAFQHIEALKKSGITTGCVANVSFCPDNTMTRAEMAVFLARALGLSYSAND